MGERGSSRHYGARPQSGAPSMTPFVVTVPPISVARVVAAVWPMPVRFALAQLGR